MGNGDMSRIKLNGAALQKLLDGNNRKLDRALAADAARVAAAARALAPVDTGEYQESIRVEGAAPHDRATYRVVAAAPHSLVVERDASVLAKALGSSALPSTRLNR